jgi:hypothetical protein
VKPFQAVDKIEPDRLRRGVGIAVAQAVVYHIAKYYEHSNWPFPPETQEAYETEIVTVVKKSLETELRVLDNQELMVLLGIEPTESNGEQFGVFLEALRIHEERNRRYQDVWTESGWKGALFDIKKKAGRLWRQFMVGKETEGADIDDAYDLINFAGFFIRGYRNDHEHPWGIWR